MALGTIQLLLEMSTRNIYCLVKAAGVYDQFRVPIILKSVSLNLLEASRPVQACTWIASLSFFLNNIPHMAGTIESVEKRNQIIHCNILLSQGVRKPVILLRGVFLLFY